MTILSSSAIAWYAQQAGITGTRLQVAVAIAMAESGGDTNALNASSIEYSVGLWQINLKAHPQYSLSQMQDPYQNAQAMAAISSGGKNWNPWSTYTNGSYLNFMKGNVNPISPGGISTTTTGYTPLATNVTTNPAVYTDTGSAWKYVLAYTIIIATLVLISKSRVGYTAIYYSLVLCLLFLFVTQARFIYNAILPVTGGSPLPATTSGTTLL